MTPNDRTRPPLTDGLTPFDIDRAGSLADEGGGSAAHVEAEDVAADERRTTIPARKSPRKPRRRYGAKAAEKVERAMHEMKRETLHSGRSGKTVRRRGQAIAIGLSQARRAGGKVPRAPQRTGSKKR